MIPILEDAVLGTDLDGQNYSLLNIKSFNPPPPNLATIDDVRLTDAREPLPGSVTNVSVAADAAIDQSKLALNGQIPTAWLGTASTTAAQGDLAEYLSNKNQPNGYAGLDATGQIPSAMLPDAVGIGTVTSIGLSMPADFTIPPPNPITGSGTFGVIWTPQPNPCWFGCTTAGTPTFQTGALPVSLIPNLNATLFTNGVFAPAQLPDFKGVGSLHAKGAVPDPGGVGAGLATDYLARDATWKTAPTISVAYQPALPNPTISHQGTGTDVTVFAGSTVANVIFFYSLTDAIGTPPGFTEFPNPGYFVFDSLAHTSGVWVYATRVGWNNSAVIHHSVP